MYQTDINQKRAEVAKLISDEADLEARTIVRDKEGHYIFIKGTTLQKDMAILNEYASMKTVPKYMRQKSKTTVRKTNKSTTAVGYFNIPLSVSDRSSRQKIMRM